MSGAMHTGRPTVPPIMLPPIVVSFYLVSPFGTDTVMASFRELTMEFTHGSPYLVPMLLAVPFVSLGPPRAWWIVTSSPPLASTR